jgi:hypothetical protein
MGYLRKWLLNLAIEEIKRNGITIGEYKIIERDGALTFIKEI